MKLTKTSWASGSQDETRCKPDDKIYHQTELHLLTYNVLQTAAALTTGAQSEDQGR